MHDEDGPVIAEAVYRASLTHSSASNTIYPGSCAEVLAKCYSPMMAEPLPEGAIYLIYEALHILISECDENRSPTPLDMVHRGFSAISSKPLPDSDAQIIAENLNEHINETSKNAPLIIPLANVVDDVVRSLRIDRKFPASRWATFVHLGM